MRAIGSKLSLLSDKNSEYYKMIEDLIDNKEVAEMREYIQHGNTSTLQHCVNVSYYNYRICKFLGLDARAAARAGLLHDLFLYDWHTYKPQPGERLHGFTHPLTALRNACRLFTLTEREIDIIEKHMWPLTISKLPRYPETFVIVMTDKICGLWEIINYRAEDIAYTFGLLASYAKKLIFRAFRRRV